MCVTDCLNCVCVFVCRINHVEDHVINQNSGMNMDDLRSVSGKELFKNNQYLVHPHTHLFHMLWTVISWGLTGTLTHLNPVFPSPGP